MMVRMPEGRIEVDQGDAVSQCMVPADNECGASGSRLLRHPRSAALYACDGSAADSRQSLCLWHCRRCVCIIM